MPRLNLDIFSEEAHTPSEKRGDPSKDAKPSLNASGKAEESAGGKNDGVSLDGAKTRPKFVPVGFHERHLRALDDAVHELRRRGHWKASKSAIIRGLIEAHEDELARFGKGERK